MSARACFVCLAALIGTAVGAQPPVKSIDVILEDSNTPRQPLLTDADIARFKQWNSREFQAKLKAAATRGQRAAKEDIKAHRFRLRECGKPAGTREIDSATGYEIEWVGSCDHLDDYSRLKLEHTTAPCSIGSKSIRSGVNDLTKRCSQPLAVPMSSFYMTSTRTLHFTLAPASGG